MAPLQEVLSMNNPVFSHYVFYATLVLLKMFSLAMLTSYRRMTRSVFANVEDVKGFGVNKEKKPVQDNEGIERVRRNHLNDLENIPAFLFLGLLYVTIQPSPFAALWHFRAFTIFRFLHMISYQLAIPQPSRAACYIGGLIVSLSMAVQLLMKAHA